MPAKISLTALGFHSSPREPEKRSILCWRQVHTPWCINCETTSKHVEKLAKHFKSLDNLVFARIDASANEHPKLQASVIIISVLLRH